MTDWADEIALELKRTGHLGAKPVAAALRKAADDPGPDYFLDRWGNCSATPCACMQMEWIGRACPNWTPLGVTSHEELQKHFLNAAPPSPL